MPKTLFILFYILLYFQSFSYTIQDYRLFKSAQSAYSEGDYTDSILKFRSLEDSFKSSPIVKSNYYKFYYALALYKKGDILRATKYMDQAVYTPGNLNGRNYFYADRNYYLGKFLVSNNQSEEAKPYFTSLTDFDENSVLHSFSHEEEAYKILQNITHKTDPLYNLKFKHDFSGISQLSFTELKSLGNYFYSKKLYPEYEKVYRYLYLHHPDNKDVIEELLHSLSLQKKSNEIIKLSDEMIKQYSYPDIFYFRGLAFIQEKNFPMAIFNLEKAQELNFKYKKYYLNKPAREIIALLYFTLGDYPKVIRTLEHKTFLSKIEESLLIEAYFAVNNRSKALKQSENFIKQYPFSNSSNYFFYIISNFKNLNSRNNNLLEFLEESQIQKLVKVSEYIYSHMKIFPLSSDIFYSNPEIEKLTKIASLQDSELLYLALENSRLLSKNPITKSYFISRLYEIGGVYKAAYENSLKNRYTFFKYKNLAYLVYPKYYSNQVEAASKKYDIPEELLYTIILTGSKFDNFFVSNERKIGLMQLELSDFQKNYLLDDLYSPDTNIELGAKKLKTLLEKNSNDKVKTLIEYSLGESILNSLTFENGDFYYYSIEDPIVRNSLNDLVNTYIYYRLLYKHF